MELIHTCYRITDPERSIAFYEALGLEKRRELPIRDEAMNYFLGVPGKPHAGARADAQLRRRLLRARHRVRAHRAHRREHEPRRWRSSPPRGSSRSAPPYSVREGGSLLCFVRDPDEYRIELIERSDY